MQLRSEITDLRPYEPGKPAAELRRELGIDRVVKLASNEGPFGPLPAADRAIREAIASLNRYPELGRDLSEALAERHAVDPARIAPGNGADGVIANLALTYLRPGDEVLIGWPSFVSYRLAAAKQGATVVGVPLREDGAYDLEAMAGRITAATRMVYICSPNNPTGGIVTREELARFLDAVPASVLVVVDAAYHEYVVDPAYGDAVVDHGDRANVAVLRTFSKMYGLAGLRVGYAVTPADVAADLARVRGPFEVSELANVAAMASLGDDAEVERRRDENRRERERLAAAVRRLGLDPLPAHGNFLCVEVGDGAELAGRLEREGVIVRPLAGFGAPTCVRVTVGSSEDNDRFVAALERCLQPA